MLQLYKDQEEPLKTLFSCFFFSFFLFLADDTTMLLHVWFLLCQLPMKKALHVEFDEVPHVGFIGKLKIRSVCNTYIRSKSMASRLFLTTAKTPVTPKYHCLVGQIRNHISITPTHIGQVTTEFEHGSSSSSSERSSKDTDMQVGTIL